jgi:hypothetical protein
MRIETKTQKVIRYIKCKFEAGIKIFSKISLLFKFDIQLPKVYKLVTRKKTEVK